MFNREKSPTLPSTSTLRHELRQAVQATLERNLVQSSKWAAQLLHSLPCEPEIDTEEPRERVDQGGGFQFSTSTPIKPLRHPTLSALNPSPDDASASSASGLKSRRYPRDSLGSVVSFGPASSPAAGPPHPSTPSFDTPDRPPTALPSTSAAAGTYTQPQSDLKNAKWLERDRTEQDVYLVALSFMRSHELMRATHCLRRCRGPKARWLRCYAKYLAGEKLAIEDAGDPLSPRDVGPPMNKYSQELLQEMSKWEPGFVNSDGYLLYLKALLLLSLPPVPPSGSSQTGSTSTSNLADDLRLTALDTLVKSVTLEPWNWSAWVKIANCLEGPEELEATLPFLPQGYPLQFFYVHCTLEIHSAGDKLHSILDKLEKVFPGPEPLSYGEGEMEDDDGGEMEMVDDMGETERGCSVIKGLRALVYYHVREFDESSSVFESLRQSDPYRIEDVDVLSNILYVSEKRAELATLAQDYVQLDRTRPEVCCLVGNYYSLRRDHEKAIVYFRRALQLDRSYLSAWTLMGHEYIEIKNTNAAIAAYRRAVDVNRKDYRAWYGLGQTYELLSEPFYALNYYRRAAGLRPYDPRMWSALANCYEKLKRIPDAIQCYQRALVASDPPTGDVDLLLRIGRLYSALPVSSESDRAASYYRRGLHEGLNQGMSTGELVKVYVWLAKWEMNKERVARRQNRSTTGGAVQGDLEKAEEYLRTVETVQEGREEAKGLLKELEVLMLSRE